ncbi:MAG TPA: hypothetical protein VEL75_06015 [Candidatus Methylomirabilis sp.]|nr:hypothetical protein [Candidatus Methylomirabilis sp.]
MRHPPPESLDAYAEGRAEVTTRLLVEAHLAICASCPGRVAESRGGARRLPEPTLHDELDLPAFENLWARVGQIDAARATPGAAALPRGLLAALPDPSGWRWTALRPNRVSVALLLRDVDTGNELYLSHFAPRGTFPHHLHLGREDNVILAGGYQSGDVHVSAGDWVVGLPGTDEMPTAIGETACWCLSRIEPPGVRFTGWRRWVAALVSPRAVLPVDGR